MFFLRHQPCEPEHFRYDPASVANLKPVVLNKKEESVHSVDSGSVTPTKREDSRMEARYVSVQIIWLVSHLNF